MSKCLQVCPKYALRALQSMKSLWIHKRQKKNATKKQEREEAKCGFPHSSQASFLRGPSVYGMASDFRECLRNLK